MQFLWQQKEDPVHGSGLQGSTVLFSVSVGVAGPVQRPSRFCHQTPHQGIQGTAAKAVIGGL